MKSRIILIFMCLFSFFFYGIFWQTNAYSQGTAFNPTIELKNIENTYYAGDFNLTIRKLNNLIFKLRPPKSPENIILISRSKLLMGLCYWKRGNSPTAILILKEAFLNHPNLSTFDSILVGEARAISKETNTPLGIPEQPIDANIDKATPVNVDANGKDASTNTSVQLDKIKPDPVKDTGSSIKVRVIKQGAILRLKADEKSVAIKELPLGGLFEVKEIADDWIKIVLPPDKDGIVVSGFIKSSFVELDKASIS